MSGPIGYDDWLKMIDGASGDARAEAVEQYGPRVKEHLKAGKKLTALIEKDKDGRVRAAAVRAFGGGRRMWGGFDPTPVLLKALRDRDPDVRVAAARTLQTYKSPEVQAALEAATQDKEPLVAGAAAASLVATWAATKQWEKLIPLLGTPEQDVGAQACLKLQQAGREAVPTLINALANEPRAPVREGIIEVLATVCNGDNEYQARFSAATLSTTRVIEKKEPPDLRAVQPLVRALRDPDESVREMAAQGLGYLGDGRAVGPLNEALLRDPSAIVRRRAASALATLPSEDALEGLSHAADEKTEPSADVRRYAVEALGWMESDEAVAPLMAALDDSEPEVRAMAARYLGQRRDKRAVPGLLRALADHSGIDDVIQVVNEWKAKMNREAAAMRAPGATLAQISEAAKQHAIAAREYQKASDELDAMYRVRWAAARALGEIRDKSARDGLIAAVSDPSQTPQVVQAARDALRKLGTLPPPTPWERAVTGG